MPDRYVGLDRFEARDMIVKDIERLGLLEKIEENEVWYIYTGQSYGLRWPRLKNVPLGPHTIQCKKQQTIETTDKVPAQTRRGNRYMVLLRGFKNCKDRRLSCLDQFYKRNVQKNE